jgi:hypothetical protein
MGVGKGQSDCVVFGTGFRPMAKQSKEKSFRISKSFIVCKNSFEFKTKLKFEWLLLSINKMEALHQHNKICSGMNATDNYLFE